VFTDLDGTLLDHDTYSWENARPAIERLIRTGVPWIFVTSKTRAETERWRLEMGNAHPFIVENGGAAIIPSGYFPDHSSSEVLEWGTRYPALVAALREASNECGCRVRGFAEMSVEEVAQACGLSEGDAALAKQRDYDEPFLVLDGEKAPALIAAIATRGLGCTKGGRFWHITGANDKGVAVAALARLYGPSTTIGLGDSLNDIPLFRQVDVPILIRSAQTGELKRHVPQGAISREPGPAGWNEAILSLIPDESPL
jgi:mannosyl-3-phosphoglycerate phosphatase